MASLTQPITADQVRELLTRAIDAQSRVHALEGLVDIARNQYRKARENYYNDEGTSYDVEESGNTYNTTVLALQNAQEAFRAIKQEISNI